MRKETVPRREVLGVARPPPGRELSRLCCFENGRKKKKGRHLGGLPFSSAGGEGGALNHPLLPAQPGLVR